MEKDIILTISLLVSNRPDTIEKCLESLQVLRQKVSSELILVDTGCGEKVRSIIEKYADQIIEFEWCKDFAKARNVGLKAAHGKWFMYLDDDEWFEDTEEMEKFFCTDEWEKYGYALYRQRNYSNKEGSIYSDALVGRMVRLNSDIRFQYSIHECFANIKGPTKIFNTYVHHYGYIYETYRDFYMHSQRNVKPLLMEHKKDIHNLRHQTHLAQEYNGLKEYKESIEISLNGISNYVPKSNSDEYINSLYVNVVECYTKMFEFSIALSYAKKYITDGRMNELGKAKMASLLCEIYYNLEDYENCISSTNSYLEAYRLQEKDSDYYANYASLFLYCFDDREINANIGFAIRASIRLKNTKLAKRFFDYIDFDKNPLLIEGGMIKEIVFSYMREEDSKAITIYLWMLKHILEKHSLLNVVLGILEKKRKENTDIFEKTSVKWKPLEDKHWYFRYLVLWTNQEELNSECVADQYEKMWQSTLDVLRESVELEIWNLADKKQINIAKILSGIPFYKWEKAVEIVCQSMKHEDLQKLNEKIAILNTQNHHYLWWKICYLQRTFKEMDGEEKVVDIDALKEDLFCYAESCWKLFQNVYSEEMFSEMSDMLPQCCQVSFYLTDLFQQENQHNFVKMVDDLKQIREINGDFAIPVKYYLKYAGEQMAQQQEEQKKTQAELADMADAVKVKVRQLIALQKYEEAKAIIVQLEQMLPGDPELSELKRQCE